MNKELLLAIIAVRRANEVAELHHLANKCEVNEITPEPINAAAPPDTVDYELQDLANEEYARLEGLYYNLRELNDMGIPVSIAQLITQPASSQMH